MCHHDKQWSHCRVMGWDTWCTFLCMDVSAIFIAIFFWGMIIRYGNYFWLYLSEHALNSCRRWSCGVPSCGCCSVESTQHAAAVRGGAMVQHSGPRYQTSCSWDKVAQLQQYTVLYIFIITSAKHVISS